MATTMNALARSITTEYLDSISGTTVSLMDIEIELMTRLSAEFTMENIARQTGNKLMIPKALSVDQVCEIMLSRCNIVRVLLDRSSLEDVATESDYDLLGLYMHDGVQRGLYVTAESYFHRISRDLNPNLTKADMETMFRKLRDNAPQRSMTNEKHLVAVNNGVFDFNTKELLSFTPELVFTSKSRVDYVANPVNPVIVMPDGVDWDVVSWVNDLSDDTEVQELLWEVMSASVRPNVSWDKAALFYSERGNNGKGTLCRLIRNLVGAGSHTAIPIADFGKDFMLEPLVHSAAVIVDENDVGVFIDKAANFKAVVTGDLVQINRKFKSTISLRFRGVVIQCLNAFLATKDKSDSFARRQLFIPFVKDFRGIERKYIKDDYLSRQGVLEYVLWRVLHMNHVEFSNPAACEALLDEYREHNDPVRDFWSEMKEQLVWDFVPFTFLYDLYGGWMKMANPGGKPVQRKRFVGEIARLVIDDGDRWTCADVTKNHRPGKRMDKAEHLIMEYGLTEWMSRTYTGANWDQRAVPVQKATYRGIERA